LDRHTSQLVPQTVVSAHQISQTTKAILVGLPDLHSERPFLAQSRETVVTFRVADNSDAKQDTSPVPSFIAGFRLSQPDAFIHPRAEKLKVAWCKSGEVQRLAARWLYPQTMASVRKYGQL
jgi:hypothetical protein